MVIGQADIVTLAVRDSRRASHNSMLGEVLRLAS